VGHAAGGCSAFLSRLAQKFKKTGSGRVEWEQYRRSGSYEPEPHAFGYFALVEDLRRLDPKKENVEWEESSSSAFIQVSDKPGSPCLPLERFVGPRMRGGEIPLRELPWSAAVAEALRRGDLSLCAPLQPMAATSSPHNPGEASSAAAAAPGLGLGPRAMGMATGRGEPAWRSTGAKPRAATMSREETAAAGSGSGMGLDGINAMCTAAATPLSGFQGLGACCPALDFPLVRDSRPFPRTQYTRASQWLCPQEWTCVKAD
jgi:hypothetical protein